MAPVTQFIRALLDTFLPPICHICHAFIPNAGTLHICPACRDQLPFISSPFCSACGIPFTGTGGNHLCSVCLRHRPHFDTARAYFLYEGHIRDLIHSFKYNRKTHLRYPLALLALEGLGGFLSEQRPHIIVPVPLHRSRLRQRGFNQAVLLGSTLSHRISLPMLLDTLTRTRQTEPQVELSASERCLNVKGAFAVRKPEQIAGKRVLLLDDVMTTGSTMNECAKELKRAGAEVVIAATIARAAKP